MKRCALVLPLGILLGNILLPDSSWAQASLFTYQGRLSQSNGVPANGVFDLQFTLRNASSGQVGQPLTNSAISISNGLFTTTLDFGAGALDGSARFLEIGVRANGGTNAFTLLSPPQSLTSTPYAYRAGVASSFPGVIADTQLSANIPRLNGNSTFTGLVTINNGTFNGAATGTFTGNVSSNFTGTATGAFLGNGAGLTNVNITNVVGVVPGNVIWQVVQQQTQQGQTMTSYLTTNGAQTTVTLPANPTVGHTLRISGAGAGGWKLAQNAGQSILTGGLGLPAGRFWTNRAGTQAWQGVAVSADGTRMAAAVNNGAIFTSADSGMTWQQQNSGTHAWHSIACSSDGTRMAAAPNGERIYTSVDSGSNWTVRANSPTAAWHSIVSSSDGSKLAAVVSSGPIYTSVDSGTNWTQRGVSAPYVAIAGSADAVRLVAVANNDKIYLSSDSGVTWTNRAIVKPWIYVACSADGVRMVAVANNDYIYVSNDGGANWVQRTSDAVRQWQSCACSADGRVMIAVVYNGAVYTSYDSGLTWTPRATDANRFWQCVACSADGSRVVAAELNHPLYVSPSSTSAGTGGFLSGVQYSAVELQYIGNGQWMPLSFTGTFSGN